MLSHILQFFQPDHNYEQCSDLQYNSSTQQETDRGDNIEPCHTHFLF